jgi:enediyne biosynthesis protein E7
MPRPGLSPRGHRSTPDVPEDWSRRVFGPRGWAQHMWLVARMVDNYAEADLDLFRRYGDVVRFHMPNPGMLFCRPRHVRHILRTHVLNYPKSHREYDQLRPLLGNGVFVSEGALWARQRRLLAPEFREKAVGRFVPTIVASAEQLFAEWDHRLTRGPIDVTHDMMRLTLWVIGRAMFRGEFLEEAEQIGHCLEVSLDQATRRMLSLGLHKQWMPTPGNIRAKRAERQLDEIVTEIIRKARAEPSDGADVLSRMIRARDPETGESMSDKQLLDETKSLILAGHETTSLALSWAFYLLARHPDVTERLVDEVNRILGDATLQAEHLPELTFTRMVFLETMRLYPPVPGVSRDVREPDELDGVRLDPEDVVIVSAYVTHRHPEYWPDPERFDPERFAPESLDDIEPFSYFPFLLGRRACLGEHFAMVEGIALLAMLVRRYRLELVSDLPHRTRPISTLRFARPLMMKVTRR